LVVVDVPSGVAALVDVCGVVPVFGENSVGSGVDPLAGVAGRCGQVRVSRGTAVGRLRVVHAAALFGGGAVRSASVAFHVEHVRGRSDR
jgi:hypothetical protein